MIPAGGVPHRREDAELVGWIVPEGDDWTAVDLLGRVVASSVEWLDAEAALEERGLEYLADPWILDRPGEAPTLVRMVEVTPDRIVVKVDDFGDVSRYAERYEVTWPIPSTLREPRDGDPDPYVF